MENQEIIFGRNPVLEYIKQLAEGSGAVLYISDNAHGKIIDIIIGRAKEKRIKIEHCTREYLAGLYPSSKHQGIILMLPRGKENTDDGDFLALAQQKKGVIVLLDQLSDPHNVGSIIRSAEALGADGVVIPKDRSADITGTVIKASAGATAYLKILTVPNIASFIEKAKKSGFWIIGTSDKGDTNLDRLKELRPAVIIIGSEGTGMRRLTQEKCDYIVAIPLKGHVSSLNASVAAGIILYEALM